MTWRTMVIVLALAVAGCDQQATKGGDGAGAPQLDAPAPASEPARVFAPANDAARGATGQLTVALTLRMPDDTSADMTDVLTLTGANGLVVESSITGAVSPATQVAGQTLRALMNLPVEEPQTLVYRVSNETKPSNGQGLCGADAAAYVVVWEPVGPGEPVMKVLAVTGGAPGAAGARPCPMLEYRRQ